MAKSANFGKTSPSDKSTEARLDECITPKEPVYLVKNEQIDYIYDRLQSLFLNSAIVRPSEDEKFYLSDRALQLVYDTILESPDSWESKPYAIIKNKRFDQFEKKYHSKLKFTIYKDFKGDRKTREEAFAIMKKHFNFTNERSFSCFLGSQLKDGLLKSIVQDVVSNPTILKSILSPATTKRVIDEMMRQVNRDIEINLMSYLRVFMDPTRPEYRSMPFLKNHIHNKRSCKKPFTSMEVLLAAEYFFDRMINEARRMKSDKSNTDIIDYLNLSMQTILAEKRKYGFDVIPKDILHTHKRKANFVRVVESPSTILQINNSPTIILNHYSS